MRILRYQLTFGVVLPGHPDLDTFTMNMTFYPHDDAEAAEYQAAMLAMRDGLRQTGRSAVLELLSEASEVVA